MSFVTNPLQADVMADTLVVERMRAEVGAEVGNLQTTCWVLRFAGPSKRYRRRRPQQSIACHRCMPHTQL